MERTLRGIAGGLIIISFALAYFVNSWWLLFILFIGLNLFQSAFTNWCPMMFFLRKAQIIADKKKRR